MVTSMRAGVVQKARVVLVEPKYQINLGYAARALKNFGLRSMWVVGPRCRITGKEAIKYSKHAHDVLEGAVVAASIKEAVRGCDIIIGTTGIWHKSEGAFMNVYPASSLGWLVRGRRRPAILVGRDDTGLTKDELAMCDATIFIPTSEGYPVMNLSHALAVLLYELSDGESPPNGGFRKRFDAEETDIDALVGLFEKAARSRGSIRNRRAVVAAFSHVVRRARPTKKELRAIAVALAPQRSPQAAEGGKKK